MVLVRHLKFVEAPQPMEGKTGNAAENQSVDEPQTYKFIWTIENISGLKVKKLYSDIFIVGGSKWRVLLYPRGNGVDYLSIYLDVADSRILPHGWSRYAKFSLAVVNQMHNKVTIKKETHHEFHAKSDWGFKSFISLADLYNPNKGYILNDKVVIEADVDVNNISEGQGTHASTRGEAVMDPVRVQASVVERQEVPPVVIVGEEKDITKVESGEAQVPAGGDGTQSSSKENDIKPQPKETVSVPEQSVTGVEVNQLQQPKDKQVVNIEKVQVVGISVVKEDEATEKVEAAIMKNQESPATSGVHTMVDAVKRSFSLQGIPEVEIPEEVPYDGPGLGSDLVEWLGFKVQRRSVAYLNKLVERYPDSLAHFSSRSPLVQAAHLGTLALLLYTTDTIPVRSWSSALQGRFLSYIEDLKEAHIELPWLLERFDLLDGLRAKVDLEEWEFKAKKLKQQIRVLRAELGMVEKKIVVIQATLEAKEDLLSDLSFTFGPDNPILSGLL